MAGYKKSRFQILAARFPSIMNPSDAGATRQELAHIIHEQGEIDAVFGRCDGWYRPWCIRVTTGHSDFGLEEHSM